jgi:Integrase core domain
MSLWQVDIGGGMLIADPTDGERLEAKIAIGVDNHSRFCDMATVAARATVRAVCRAFAQALGRNGAPEEILSDNRLQFTTRFGAGGEVLFDRICRHNCIAHRLTQPASPTTTGKVERFHQTLRRELLNDGEIYPDLAAAQAALDADVDQHDISSGSAAYLPGNSFHALLRVNDHHGNWQTAQQPFTMKRRSITVDLDEIHIIDDGADGSTTASFFVWVLNGARLKNRFDVPEQTISDSPSAGDVSEELVRFSDISSDVTVEIGPDTVTTTGINGNDTLGILTRGIAAVTIGDDHISGDYLPGPDLGPGDPPDLFTGSPDPGTLFPFPIGRDHEEVDRQPFVVRAKPPRSA